MLLCALLSFSGMVGAAPPIGDYINPSKVEVGSLQISPDGAHLSWISPREDRSHLVVYNRTKEVISAQVGLKPGQYVHDYWWVNNRRLVMSISESKGSEETPSITGELWAIDADGSNGKYLIGEAETRAATFVLEPTADADDSILVGVMGWSYSGDVPYLRLARMNINSGRLKESGGRLPVRYVDTVLSDSTGQARVVSGDTADRDNLLLYRDPADGQWRTVNDSHNSKRLLFPLAFADSDTRIYVAVSEAGKPDYLATLDLSTGKETVLFKPENADIGGVQLTANGRDAYAVRNYDGDGKGGFVFWNKMAPEAILHKELFARFPGELVEITGFTRDGSQAVVFVHSDLNPGKYYLYSRAERSLTMLTAIRPGIRAEMAASVEPLVFKAGDGLQIHAWLTSPNTPAAGGKFPLVVLPHGGPYGTVDRWGFDSEAQLLVSRGYAVLQVNFRGSGGYGQSFVDAGLHEWGGKMQSDLSDGVRAALAAHPIDPGRICIYGASYGAYAALMAVATEPGLYRCAIGYSGVYDLRLMRSQGDINDTAWGRSFLSEIMPDDKDWLAARSPTGKAESIKSPVLLIHGGKDERTPPKHAKVMRDALTKAGNPPKWLYKENEGHGFFDVSNELEAYTAILDFLDANIGAKVSK